MIKEESYLNDYPKKITYDNKSIAGITAPIPGVIEIESKKGTDKTLIFSCGIHGNERAGIDVLDTIIYEIILGKLVVNNNILLIYGNLKAIPENNGKGVRCIETELGRISNLNRCFIHNQDTPLKSYAQKRANLIIKKVLNNLIHGRIDVLDIHQSFQVPRVADIRGNQDRTEYTYAIVYPNGINNTLKWVYEEYSDIVAGVVLNDMNTTHSTLAGFMSQKYGANSATLELGTIGYNDWVSFTPQLIENIRKKIRGDTSNTRYGFDIWEVAGSIIKNSPDFSFLDKNGEKTNTMPYDFLPVGYSKIAQDKEEIYSIRESERLLFSNSQVPLGDRVAMIIKKFYTDAVPAPRL